MLIYTQIYVYIGAFLLAFGPVLYQVLPNLVKMVLYTLGVRDSSILHYLEVLV